MDSPTSPLWSLLCIVPVVLAVVVAWVRHRADRRPVAAVADSPTEPANAPLRRRATAALVALDDAVRSSAEELGHAEAQLGTAATAPFRTTVESARAKVDDAFHVLHELEEDHEQGTVLEAVERVRLEEVLALTSAADSELDAQEEAFARLRDLHAQVPEMLASLRARAEEVAARAPVGRQVLDGLRPLHPEAVLVTPTQDLERATALVDATRRLTGQGEEHLASGNRDAAVTAARAAEQALGQAHDLLTTVIGAGDDLAEADAAMGTALASLSSDIAEAEQLGALGGSAVLDEARAAVAAGARERKGGDVLGALARLERAEHHLDAALEPHRHAAPPAGMRRATSATPARQQSGSRRDPVLTRRARHVRARINHASQLVTTRREHLSHLERELVVEALRLVVRAEKAEDPGEAADLLSRAESLADRAEAAASSSYGYDKYRPSPEAQLLGGVLAAGLVVGGSAAGGSQRSRGGGFGGSSGGFGGGGRF